MSSDGTAPGEVRQALPWLAAMDTVLAHPALLVALLDAAEDDEAAVASISDEFGLSTEHASVVLDNQFRLLVRSRRAALAEELRILRAPWREPREVVLQVTGPGSAVLVLDDTEHSFTGGGTPALLEQVAEFLRARVVDAELQPVVVLTGLHGRDPVRMRIWPGGTTAFDQADDPPDR